MITLDEIDIAIKKLDQGLEVLKHVIDHAYLRKIIHDKMKIKPDIDSKKRAVGVSGFLIKILDTKTPLPIHNIVTWVLSAGYYSDIHPARAESNIRAILYNLKRSNLVSGDNVDGWKLSPPTNLDEGK